MLVLENKLPYSIMISDFKVGRFKGKLEIKANQSIVLEKEEINSSATIQKFIYTKSFVVHSDEDNFIILNLKRMPATAVAKKPSKEKIEYSQKLEYPLSTKSDCIEMRWGGIFDSTGYGEVNRELVKRLVQRGIRIKVNAFRKSINELDESTINFLGEVEKTKLQDPENALIVACFIPQSFGVNQKFRGYRIGYTMFESSGLWKEYISLCNSMNEIWVPSTFNLTTFRQGGVDKPIRVMPIGIDTEKFNPDIAQPLEGFKDQFVFLFVGTWSLRKGYDALVKAYLREFSHGEPVLLLIKSSYQGRFDENSEAYIYGEIADMIRGVGKGSKSPQIKLYDKMISRNAMPRLYKTASVLILPTRGEGWAMPVQEAMAMEVPVITTRWSGMMDFAKEDNSYLIDSGKVRYDHKVGQDSLVFYREGFVEPNIDHLQYLMRKVFINYEEAKKRAQKARKDIEANFTWDRSVDIIHDRLKEIYGK